MKIKLDENLPARLADLLKSWGHDADTVADEGLKGRPDPDIWAAARKENRFLITQDLDFPSFLRAAWECSCGAPRHVIQPEPSPWDAAATAFTTKKPRTS